MKKRLLCVLVAAVLLLGVLAGCGGGSENDGASSSPDSGNPGVDSTKPAGGGHTDDDPVAVMKERVKAVNDALNWELIGVEETLEAGLLFYGFTAISSPSDGPHEYNPDKPLDYEMTYQMYKQHTEAIVSEDTYDLLLKNTLSLPSVEDVSDVIETDDLYIWYNSSVTPYGLIYHGATGAAGGPAYDSGGADAYDAGGGATGGGNVSNANIGRCAILVKGTDILYRFSVAEMWFKADYNEDGHKDFYNGEDAEYIFTTEYWKAFAQTVKFVGKADEDFKDGVCIDYYDSTIGIRGEGVKVPYIEEWYAGQTLSLDAIRSGFEEFLESFNGDYGYGEGYGFLVIDDFGQGEPTMFLNTALYKYTGNGEVALLHDFADIDEFWMGMSTDAGRTHLLFSAGYPFGEDIMLVDLKTFEITDTARAVYDLDSEGYPVFLEGSINGEAVDEETALEACDEWYSIYNINLCGRGGIDYVDLDSAWGEYIRRG